jgi:hypothetical protein
MSAIGPQIPPHLLNAADDDDSDKSSPEPLLQAGTREPPHPANEPKFTTSPVDPSHSGDDGEEDEDAYLPALPPDLVATKRKLGPALPAHSSQTQFHDDLSDEEVGPMPAPAGLQTNSADDAVREFMEREERRRKADEEASRPKKLQREEWMLVPPSSSSVLGCMSLMSKLPVAS